VPPPPPLVVVDAAVPPTPPDAPEAPTLEITIETVPPDATIQQDGVDKGIAPVTTRLVVDNHFTEFVASALGYEDKPFKINAMVDKKTHYKIVLKKAPGATVPRPQPPRQPPQGGKPAGDTGDKTNHELGGNPFIKNGSNAPPGKP
jgi:hypothetical protein